MVNIGQEYQKGGGGANCEKKGKIKNPYLNEHLHIDMNSHI